MIEKKDKQDLDLAHPEASLIPRVERKREMSRQP